MNVQMNASLMKLAMEFLDMMVTAGNIKWHKESEVSVGRTRGILIRFKCSLVKFKYRGRAEIGWKVIKNCTGLQCRSKS